jgi:hypothetical protein
METQSGKGAAKIKSEAQAYNSSYNLNKPIIFLLTEDGMILNVNKEGERLFDCADN